MERNNMRTGIMKLMLAVVFVIGSLLFVPGLSADVKAETIIDSGTCGDNVTWKLSGSGGSYTLTISERIDRDSTNSTRQRETRQS